MTPAADPRRVRAAAQRRDDAAAGRRRGLPVGGRLARRHQRHARDDGVQLEVGRVPADDRGPRADAHARDPRRARGEDPRVPAARLLGDRRHVPRRRRRVHGPLVRREVQALRGRPRPPRRAPVGGGARARHRRHVRGQAGHRHRGGEADDAEPAAAVRPHEPAARGQRPLRLLGAHDAVARAGAVREAQGPHLSADRRARAAGGLHRHRERHAGGTARDQRVRRLRARDPEAEVGAAEQAHLRQLEDLRPLRDHPHARAAEEPERGRGQALRPRRAALPRRVLSGGRAPASRRGSRAWRTSRSRPRARSS